MAGRRESIDMSSVVAREFVHHAIYIDDLVRLELVDAEVEPVQDSRLPSNAAALVGVRPRSPVPASRCGGACALLSSDDRTGRGEEPRQASR